MRSSDGWNNKVEYLQYQRGGGWFRYPEIWRSTFVCMVLWRGGEGKRLHYEVDPGKSSPAFLNLTYLGRPRLLELQTIAWLAYAS